MNAKRFIFLIFLWFFFIHSAVGQNFEWLKGFGSKNVEGALSVCAEENGGSVLLLSYGNEYNIPSGIDTLDFDTIRYIIPRSFPYNYKNFLVRLDSSGKTIGAALIDKFRAAKMCRDDSGNLYIIGGFQDTNQIQIGSTKLRKADGGLLIIKYDKNFNLKWVKQTGNIGTSADQIIYSNNRLYFFCRSKGKTILDSATYNLANSSVATIIFGELNLKTGSIKWARFFYNNTTNHEFYLTGMVNLKGLLYFSGRNSSSTLNINGDPIYQGGFVIETDSIGVYKKRFLVHSVEPNHGIDCITTDGEYLYIGGSFTDSIKWGNKIIYSGYTNNISRNNFFAASITTSFTPRWFFCPKILNANFYNSGNGSGYLINSKYHGGFLYFVARLYDKIAIDSQIFRTGYNLSALIFKSDLRGNILWATEGGDNAEVLSMDAIKEKGVYIAGLFNGGIKFGPFQTTSKSYDGWITKISDNAIIRGPVKFGPYCAGDSIKIPYTKLGDYDTSNIFIAQLSNEFGNFDSAYHELGRLKSNKDGTVTGKLPDIHISSSGQYRIRIMSTAPKVQSYYKADTLRLLIFSRDKANPGKDVTICRGDTVTIKTYGGTKWTWSPKYRMMDSTKAATLVWPDKTTKYKIIIADSSGCGVADTAFKTVIVRKDPKIQITTPKDTVVCVGGSLPIVANFNFGDSLHYEWQWYAIDKTGGYTEVKTGTAKNSDTLMYTLPATEKDSQRFVLFLNDGCSPKNDFAYYTIKVSKVKPDAVFESKDTAVCAGSATSFIAHFTKGFAPGYTWKWMEKDANGFWQNIVSRLGKTSDTLLYTLPLSWMKNKKKVVGIALTDGCSPFADTALLNISLRDTLQIALNTMDTAMCRGTAYTWRATGTGGYAPNYSFKWTNASNGQLLSTADSLRITADSSLKVTVSLTDNCMPKAIKTSFTLNVNPPLKAGTTIQDTTLCYGQILQAVAQGSGGKGSGYTFNWKLNTISIGSTDTLQFNTQQYFTKAGGIQQLVLTVGDNCTAPNDSIKIKLTVLPAIKTTFLFPDTVCYKNKVVFKAKGSGGKGLYAYKWIDANNVFQSNADSLVINYNNVNQSGTVKRIVTVTDGCSLPDTNIVISEFLRPLSLNLTAADTCPTLSTLLTAVGLGGNKQNYTYSWWKENLSLGSTIVGSKIVTPNLTNTVFKAVLKDGCSDVSDTATIRIGLKPALSLDVKGFCLGETTIGKVGNGQLAVGKGYNWQLDNVSLTGTDSIIKMVLPAIGKYQLKVSSDNSAQCIGRDTVDFSIIEQPKADFSYERLSDFSSGIPFQFNDLSANANAWLWQFGKNGNSNLQHPLYNFTDTGYIRVQQIASNQNICFDTMVKLIPVYDRIQFYFPNAFSPNGNSINDGFGLNPGQYYLVKTYHLEIYNRWGELLFKTDDVHEQWNGTLQGVYLFKAVITDIFGEKREVTGAVEVLK